MAVQAGAARRIIIVASAGQAVRGGPAVAVRIVTDGRAVSSEPPLRCVIVSGRPVQGGPILPVVQVAATTPRVEAGAATPIVLA